MSFYKKQLASLLFIQSVFLWISPFRCVNLKFKDLERQSLITLPPYLLFLDLLYNETGEIQRNALYCVSEKFCQSGSLFPSLSLPTNQPIWHLYHYPVCVLYYNRPCQMQNNYQFKISSFGKYFLRVLTHFFKGREVKKKMDKNIFRH